MIRKIIYFVVSCSLFLSSVVHALNSIVHTGFPSEVQTTPSFSEKFNNGNRWEPRYDGVRRGKCYNDMSTVSYGYYGFQGLFLDVQGGYTFFNDYPYFLPRCKTAMIQTKQSEGSFGYGYYEVRAYFKDNSGSQYALWLSNGINEIDMFEIVGRLDSNVDNSTSYHTIWSPNAQYKLADLRVPSSGQWRTSRKLGFLWTKNKIEIWQDGILKKTKFIEIPTSSATSGRIIISNEVKDWGAGDALYIPSTTHSMRIYDLKYYPLKP